MERGERDKERDKERERKKKMLSSKNSHFLGGKKREEKVRHLLLKKLGLEFHKACGGRG